MNRTPIRYRIRPLNPAAHRYEVVCTVERPDPAGQRFALPAWIPGSYLIRDFARHIVAIRAESGGRPVRLSKLDKHTWQAVPLKPGQPVSVVCEIHAWDLSVRGAYLDETRGFFNGANVFLRVLGQEEAPCLVDIQPPADKRFAGWRLATTLSAAGDAPGRAKRHGAGGFGLFRATDYDDLIDHPVEMGDFAWMSFRAGGVTHDIALSGRHDADLERLAADLEKVCAWQIRFFGEPAPFKRYLFLIAAVGDGYGGLEHRASTALICARRDLPWRGMPAMTEGYRGLLGLCSHEYFHAWNVKRIKPAAFVPYDLERENYTRQLWAFEGITSYYDDLALLRSGVIGIEDWLALLAKTIDNVQKTPGRLRQSLAESSFDAWSKFYKPDENTPNAVVSYYAKGALVALGLDLTLRRKSEGKISLDALMRGLWRAHGQTGIGVGEDGVRKIAEAVSGLDLRRFFADYVHGVRELPLKRLLADFGVRLEWEAAKTPALGVRTSNEGNEVRLATVYDGGAAQRAGLASGDLLIAIDGLRVTPATLDKQLARHAPGDMLRIHAFRRDELMEFSLRLDPPPADTAKLSLGEKKDSQRRAWLGA